MAMNAKTLAELRQVVCSSGSSTSLGGGLKETVAFTQRVNRRAIENNMCLLNIEPHEHFLEDNT